MTTSVPTHDHDTSSRDLLCRTRVLLPGRVRVERDRRLITPAVATFAPGDVHA